jgi:integrase/recombinase XerC
MQPSSVYNYTLALRRLAANIGASIGRPDLKDQVPRTRVPVPRKTTAAPHELARLLSIAPAWLRTIILLAAHAGMRRSDCLAVAPIHYDADKKTITITQKKTATEVTVPVTSELAANLEAAPTHDPHTPYYALHRGRKLSTSAVEAAWRKLKNKAQVNPNLWLHDLRRTLAVSLYEISKDLRIAEQMLGHRSLGSTIRYLEHSDPAKLKPYLDSLFIPKGAKVQ